MTRRLLPLLLPALLLAACGSSGGGIKQPTVGRARTFSLTGFTPAGKVAGKSADVGFTVDKPTGGAMIPANYTRGAGPHTGVHLIIVRDDLTAIVHRHPHIGADGRIQASIAFPGPGRYRVLIDIYSALSNTLPNFQLTRNITVGNGSVHHPLPPFKRVVKVRGYTLSLASQPHIKALQPATLSASITRPNGSPATFTPWYGALAHAIFFRDHSLDYFHTHVCGAGAPNCLSRIGGAAVTGHPTSPGHLNVGVLLPVSGTWRLFLQCKIDGHILTAPFTLKVS
jgi:hypothetical protein